MSKEHIEELLRKVSQSNNDDYLALTIGSLFSDMEQQNKRYREALEFYANKDNYEPFGDIMRGHIVVLIQQDKGTHAREALEVSE